MSDSSYVFPQLICLKTTGSREIVCSSSNLYEFGVCSFFSGKPFGYCLRELGEEVEMNLLASPFFFSKLKGNFGKVSSRTTFAAFSSLNVRVGPLENLGAVGVFLPLL